MELALTPLIPPLSQRIIDIQQCIQQCIQTLTQKLPRNPVEPVFIQFASFETFRLGELFAPAKLCARNIVVQAPLFACFGRTLRVELVLSSFLNIQTHAAELETALESISQHTCFSVTLLHKTQQPLYSSLHVSTASLRFSSRSVIFNVAIPFCDPDGDANGDADAGEIVIDDVAFAGETIPGTFRINVHAGMHAPQQIMASYIRKVGGVSHGVSITKHRELFVAQGKIVLTLACDGTPRKTLFLDDCKRFTTRAVFDDKTRLLLLLSTLGGKSTLDAIDTVSMKTCWSSKFQGVGYDIALLSAHGVCCVSDSVNYALKVFCIADGTHLTDTSGSYSFTHIVADSLRETVYACVGGQICAFHWDGSRLELSTRLQAISFMTHYRPLAIMPSPTDKNLSFLLVGARSLPDLWIIELPSHRLVKRCKIGGMKIVGLDSDPSGTALAVCDEASKSIHILPWPEYFSEIFDL
jgi:hypothetical protein